jgi:uncharacterized damage-inducible protein DinB
VVQLNLFANLHCRFDYHFWASKKLVDAFTDEDAHERATGYLAHAFVADRLRLARIKGEPLPADLILFPKIPLTEIRSRLTNNAAKYTEFLSTVHPSAIIAYTTTTGTTFKNTVDDFPDHVLLHGMYHRGSAAAALRAVGTAPPSTNYIKWARREEEREVNAEN